MHVATGKYSVHFGKTGTFTAKLSAAGLKLLMAAKRMKAKATLSSHDASGAKGVTAWLVSMQAPRQERAKHKPAVKKAGRQEAGRQARSRDLARASARRRGGRAAGPA